MCAININKITYIKDFDFGKVADVRPFFVKIADITNKDDLTELIVCDVARSERHDEVM